MRSRLRGAAAAVLAGTALTVLAGCYWTRYDAVARTHVELLRAMSAKLDDVTARDGVPPPAMAEFRYPLERARDFARIAERRFAGRASLAAFWRLCDAYEAILGAADRLRAAPEDAATRTAFAARVAALEGHATAVVAALDRERAG